MENKFEFITDLTIILQNPLNDYIKDTKIDILLKDIISNHLFEKHSDFLKNTINDIKYKLKERFGKVKYSNFDIENMIGIYEYEDFFYTFLKINIHEILDKKIHYFRFNNKIMVITFLDKNFGNIKLDAKVFYDN